MPLPVRFPAALAVAGFASLSSLTSTSHAVIPHAVDEFTPVPGPVAIQSIVGRWGTNASAVAIGPNHIVTTRHQAGGVGTVVVFNGVSYEVAQETVVGSADLRVARITTVGGGGDANLGSYATIYTGSGDAGPLQFTMAGYGRGRGADLTTTGGTYGYQWDAAQTTNSTYRAGRNTIDGSATENDTILGSVNVTTDVLFADFDGAGRPTAITAEAILSEFDSGGGWFVENGAGNWQLAALSRAVGHVGDNADNPNTPAPPADAQPFNQALFASFQNAAMNAPDYMDGVRLSSYSAFINSVVPEPGAVGLLAVGACAVLVRRRRTRG